MQRHPNLATDGKAVGESTCGLDPQHTTNDGKEGTFTPSEVMLVDWSAIFESAAETQKVSGRMERTLGRVRGSVNERVFGREGS